MAWLLYVILSVLPLVYWYLTRNHNYWSKRGIKGPKPLPGIGNILDIFMFSQIIQEVKWFNKFGKIYGYYMGNSPVLTIGEPELIKTIMVKDFHLFPDRRPNRSEHPILSKVLVFANGNDWKRIRSISSPTFTSGKMKKMYPLIRKCLNDFMSHLETYAKDRKDINAKDMYGNFTMDVIATCAFATKTNIHNELDNDFVVNARTVFNLNIWSIIKAIILPKFIFKVFKLSTTNSAQGTEFFLKTLRQILEERRKSNKKFNDFLQLLIDAGSSSPDNNEQGQNDTSESHHVNEGEEELNIEKKVLNVNLVNKHLTENELLAQAFIFLLAGYETTATTLTYCTYELALQPQLQDRLYDEVNAALDSNGEISYEELSKLPFLDAVLSETLRLHSPAIRIARMSSTDYKLGDTGITLSKGQLVEIPVYAIHHSEEFYPEPFKFNPDRFMPENRHLIQPYTYLPFGAGPRNCIGMRFALLEAKLGLAQIIRRFKFFRSEQTDVPLLPKIVFRLNTPKRVIVGIEKRPGV